MSRLSSYADTKFPSLLKMETLEHSMRETRTFSSHYEQIREVCQFIIRGAEQAGFDAKARLHIELACDEACTNIIEHAYGSEGRGDIVVSWEVVPDSFVITLTDTGQSFEPDAKKKEQISAETTIDKVPIGGLGMHFIYKLMDDVHYQFENTHNTVTLVKWRPERVTEAIRLRTLRDGIVLIQIAGRLDQVSAEKLEHYLSPLLTQPAPRILIDLTETDYVNSVGLRVLVTAWRKSRQLQGDLVVFGLNDRLTEIFAMVGFDKILRLFNSREDSLAYLRQ